MCVCVCLLCECRQTQQKKRTFENDHDSTETNKYVYKGSENKKAYNVIGIFEGVTSSSIIIPSLVLPVLSFWSVVSFCTTSFVVISHPISQFATPLSALIVLATSILSLSFDETEDVDEDEDEDGIFPEGLGESFSKECVESGEDVIELNVELKAFVTNIFGVVRPLKVSLFVVEESGLGHIGKGDMIGDELWTNYLLIPNHYLLLSSFNVMLSIPLCKKLFVWLR